MTKAMHGKLVTTTSGPTHNLKRQSGQERKFKDLRTFHPLRYGNVPEILSDCLFGTWTDSVDSMGGPDSILW